MAALAALSGLLAGSGAGAAPLRGGICDTDGPAVRANAAFADLCARSRVSDVARADALRATFARIRARTGRQAVPVVAEARADPAVAALSPRAMPAVSRMPATRSQAVPVPLPMPVPAVARIEASVPVWSVGVYR